VESGLKREDEQDIESRLLIVITGLILLIPYSDIAETLSRLSRARDGGLRHNGVPGR
jgi:hypothetical protein